jgi:ABC-type bacteriocin/lantibiotic exporter with double-glycine peptidase domain
MKARRRLLVPEIVQTSNMDCGPAALKCLLEGFGISVSYGRLREACQTDVDGTSIDMLEETANLLGLEAEQIVVPVEHVLLDEAASLPALAVVVLANGLTHFVVIWRSYRGKLVQVMDPAVGRRFIPAKRFLESLYRHRMQVASEDWNEYARSENFQVPLRARLERLGVEPGVFLGLEPSKLDAAARAAAALVAAGAIDRGQQAGAALDALLADPTSIPQQYWTVRPAGEGWVSVTGAVLVRALGPKKVGSPGSPELVSALTEKSDAPGRHLLRLLAEDGWLSPVSLLLALLLAAAGVLLEAVLFQGLLRGLLGAWRVAAFSAILLLLEWPTVAGLLRTGRRLDIRLRIAFLRKLPRLPDRYLQSRLKSDMAERSHNLHLIRRLPELGGQLLRSVFELILTAAAIAWIDPPGALYAAGSALFALALPLLAQPLLLERDLRLRTHSGALSHFYLDALLGLFAIHSHRAQPLVRRQHERLLATWARAGFALQRLAVLLEAAQLVTGFGLAAWLLSAHLTRHAQAGAVLLLVYWALNLPVLGETIASIAWQYPSYRNITLRMLEPLGARERPATAVGARERPATAVGAQAASGSAAAIRFENVDVTASGQTILHSIDLEIAAGEHVAIVGQSGAGKSSLVGLLLGWYRASAGRILVDGEALDEESFRGSIAWLDPGVQIWNRTLEENIRYGAGTADVQEAMAAARLQSIADRMDVPLGEGGGLVSGGEGQRVRFARAYIRPHVRLAILDEPFRGLDLEHRRALLQEARQRWSGATLLCITHDLSETFSFDRVVVMEEGGIREQGRPHDLAKDPDSRFSALLGAEQQVRERMWSHAVWRRVKVEAGRLRELAG